MLTLECFSAASQKGNDQRRTEGNAQRDGKIQQGGEGSTLPGQTLCSSR